MPKKLSRTAARSSQRRKKTLRQAIADANSKKKGAKKILVLMNPPYAEAMNVDNTTAANGKNAETKQGVASTRIGASMEGLGYAARELFVQFLVRTRLPSSMPRCDG